MCNDAEQNSHISTIKNEIYTYEVATVLTAKGTSLSPPGK